MYHQTWCIITAVQKLQFNLIKTFYSAQQFAWLLIVLTIPCALLIYTVITRQSSFYSDLADTYKIALSKYPYVRVLILYNNSFSLQNCTINTDWKTEVRESIFNILEKNSRVCIQWREIQWLFQYCLHYFTKINWESQVFSQIPKVIQPSKVVDRHQKSRN